MAKVFGGRWRIREQIGQGGQSHVFLVDDLQQVECPPRVLKRILNPRRHERFVREVDACKRLAHPNIMGVLDHSALVADASEDERMFLVMPFMAGGALSERVTLYKGALDTALEIGAALASGLGHAHKASVIHRDVKPENILFDGQNNAPVISDFGICLIRDTDRSTETGEVVGPRAFIAPELEDGGKLDASPAADVYSLGKVLYYVLSGGVVVPRERHREQKYDIFAGRGVRHELIGRLLDRMICGLNQRLQSMENVAREIAEIREWDQNLGSAFSAGSRAALDRIVERGREIQTVDAHNKRVQQARQATLTRYTESVREWLLGHVSELAKGLTHEGISQAKVLDQSEIAKLEGFLPDIQFGANVYGDALLAAGLSFSLDTDVFHKKHCLLFRLVVLNEWKIRIGIAKEREESGQVGVAFVPFYFKDKDWKAYFATGLREKSARLDGRLVKTLAEANVFHRSTAQTWPADVARYKQIFDRSCEIFLDRMDRWPRSGAYSLE